MTIQVLLVRFTGASVVILHTTSGGSAAGFNAQFSPLIYNGASRNNARRLNFVPKSILAESAVRVHVMAACGADAWGKPGLTVAS